MTDLLLDYCHLVVMRRDDDKFSPPPAIQAWLDCHVANDKNVIHAKPAGHVVLTNTPLFSVSSTDDLSNLWLEESVLDYINEHQLYKS